MLPSMGASRPSWIQREVSANLFVAHEADIRLEHPQAFGDDGSLAVAPGRYVVQVVDAEVSHHLDLVHGQRRPTAGVELQLVDDAARAPDVCHVIEVDQPAIGRLDEVGGRASWAPSVARFSLGRVRSSLPPARVIRTPCLSGTRCSTSATAMAMAAPSPGITS